MFLASPFEFMGLFVANPLRKRVQSAKRVSGLTTSSALNLRDAGCKQFNFSMSQSGRNIQGSRSGAHLFHFGLRWFHFMRCLQLHIAGCWGNRTKRATKPLKLKLLAGIWEQPRGGLVVSALGHAAYEHAIHQSISERCTLHGF